MLTKLISDEVKRRIHVELMWMPIPDQIYLIHNRAALDKWIDGIRSQVVEEQACGKVFYWKDK